LEVKDASLEELNKLPPIKKKLMLRIYYPKTPGKLRSCSRAQSIAVS